MNKLIVLCILLAFSSTTVFGQSKAEAKKLKAEIKKLMKNPAAYKAIKEELNVLRSESSSKNRELATLRKEITNVKAEAATKDAQINELKTKMNEVVSEPKDITPCGEDYTKGVVYKVQVGAFTKKIYSEKIDGKFWEEDADGVKKYTIGHFRDYWEADKFKKYLRAIGVSDAWIVAYEDNQRKDIKAILDKED